MDSTRKQTPPVDPATPLLRDEECERVVLGSMMSNNYDMEQLRHILTPECFYTPLHHDIYLAIMAVDSRGDRPDMIIVNAELARQGVISDPLSLMEIASHAAVGSITTYAARLSDLATRRRFWEIAQKLMQGALTEIDDIADVQQSVKADIDGIFSRVDDRIVSIADSSKELLEHVSRNMHGEKPVTGTPTGFKEIDRRGGLQKQDLVIIAGETSMGKSALATTISANAVIHGEAVAYYSMEMSTMQLTARIVAGQSGVSSSEMLFQQVSIDKFSHIAKGVDAVRHARLYFDDSASSSLDKIILSIRSMKAKHDITGVVIDFLQRLSFNTRQTTQEQAIGRAAQRLKDIAKELDIWVIALSQLSRNRDYPQPTLNRLRDSGQIEEAADTVILIYRPERVPRSPSLPAPFEAYCTDGVAYIDVAKGRNIGTFSFLAHFDAPTTRFIDGDLSTFPKRGVDPTAHHPTDDNPF